jgi:hypothetical protein
MSGFGIEGMLDYVLAVDNTEKWRVSRKFKQLGFFVKQYLILIALLWFRDYQGNCKGVGRPMPIVTSAVPISPVQVVSTKF